MTSFVELLIAAMLGAPVPAAVEAEVRAAVSERWRVAADAIELTWGRVPAGLEAAPFAGLGGTGSRGWFSVRLATEAGDPVVLRVRAGVRALAPVAAHALATGATLAADDLAWQPATRWGEPAGTAFPASPEPGWIVKRPIAAGEPLAWPAVAPPPAVLSGAPVTLVWEQGGLRVTRTGVALNGATLGGWVRVRVEGRTGPFVGRAIAKDEVQLSGGVR